MGTGPTQCPVKATTSKHWYLNRGRWKGKENRMSYKEIYNHQIRNKSKGIHFWHTCWRTAGFQARNVPFWQIRIEPISIIKHCFKEEEENNVSTNLINKSNRTTRNIYTLTSIHVSNTRHIPLWNINIHPRVLRIRGLIKHLKWKKNKIKQPKK